MNNPTAGIIVILCLLIGVILGAINRNMSIIEDCELINAFTIGNVAYECKVIPKNIDKD